MTIQFVNVADKRTVRAPPRTRRQASTTFPGRRMASPSAALSPSGRCSPAARTSTASPATISYADINAGDIPTVKREVRSFTYKNAQHDDVTATLTAEQLAAIEAVEVPLVVVQDPAGKNNGTATWTYSIADGAFDFLAAGETLTLTYMARVDNNFAPNNETTFVPFTITITGTNDAPTIATSGGAITERVGTGNTTLDTVSGTVTFTDADLTDRPDRERGALVD